MPELWLHDGTAPRKARELYYHDGTAARKIREAWYHDGTAPRRVFSGESAVNIANRSISQSNFGTAPALAGVTFWDDGRLSEDSSPNIDTFVPGQWLSPSPVDPSEAALYEIYATRTGDALGSSSDATGTWLPLSQSRDWYISVGANAGHKSATVTVTVRKIGTTSPTYTATYSLDAESSNA